MKRKQRNLLAALFGMVSDAINGMELSFLNLLSALVPYAVPVIPAYLTFFHTKSEMDFPEWVAWTAAFVTEVLGITSVATAIKFYRHNTIYRSARNKAPFWLAVSTYAFYIVVVLSVNVILEVVAGVRSTAVIVAIGLFSLLSFPSAVLISIRAQYHEMLEERAERRENLNAGGSIIARSSSQNVSSGSGGLLGAAQAFVRGVSGSTLPGEPSERRFGFAGIGERSRTRHASDYRVQILRTLDDHWTATRTVLGPTAIARKLKLDPRRSKGYIHSVIKEWKRTHNIQ